jgi:hypothetical protein
MSGKAVSMSTFPTMATVNPDGSLKQLLKYWQAPFGSTLIRSFVVIGCTNGNTFSSVFAHPAFLDGHLKSE